jgi:hypothetical protein
MEVAMLKNDPYTVQIDERLRSEQRVAAQEYLHTPRAGTIVPILQSIISGLLVGIPVWVMAAWAGIMDAWMFGAVTFFLVTGGAWALLLRHWYSLTSLEQMTGLDLNRDGKIGAGKPQVHEVRIRMSGEKDGHFRETISNLPASPEQMQKLAEGILGNPPVPFTVRQWCGDKKPFSDSQFVELRTALLKARTFDNEPLLVASSDKGARRGFEFTQQGLEVLQGFLAADE